MKLTVDTITDQQIRTLMGEEYDGVSTLTHAEWCNALLYPTTRLGRHARARCAEILNARKEGK